MFIRKILCTSTFLGSDSLRHYLRISNHSYIDPNTFFNKLREEYDSLSPTESVIASDYLSKILEDTSRCSFSPNQVLELKKELINNVRSKLYSLSDLNELCNITIQISKSGILSKAYVSDFLSRLDKLIVGINFECVPAICESLNLLHINGHNVDNACIKFYNVLVSDNILEKLDNLSLLKLVKCSINLNISNSNLDRKMVSEIKERTKLNRIPTDVLISLVEVNHFTRSRFYFLNPLMISSILKDPQVPLGVVIKCLNSCKNLKHSFERVDKLYVSSKDELDSYPKLDILDNFARFKYKPYYLHDILDDITKGVSELNFKDILRLFKNIYELNVNNQLVIETFKECINSNKDLEYNERYCDVLLAMCYFHIKDANLYNSILYEVIRNEYRLNDGDKIKLQIFNTALRCDYMDCGVGDLIDGDIKGYLENLTEYYEVKRSSQSKYILNLILSLSYTVYEKVKVGGFYCDFIRPYRRGAGTFIPAEHGVAILVDECYLPSPSGTGSDNLGDSHSNNSGSSTNRREECSKYVLMKNILNRLNVKYVCISLDVMRDLNRNQQLEYLKRLISRHTS